MRQTRLFIYLAQFFLWLALGLFLLVLLQKTLLAHKYYEALSKNNLTQVKTVIAPRGVFFDRDGVLLSANKKEDQHGYLRQYFFPKSLSHLLGYLGLPSALNLKDYVCDVPPSPNQYIGQAGLESYYECRLRGKNGQVIYESNASQTKKRQMAFNPPLPGENINLSISTKLYQVADREFRNKKGGVIASNPQTGEIYLLASYPNYSVNDLTESDKYQALLANQDHPLFNRLTLGRYPPGSVIKPLVGLAALEERIINQETKFEDTGVFKLGNNSFGNWYFLQYGKKEEDVNLTKALSRSNDIFFYQIGVKLGIEKLDSWFKRFGLAEKDLSLVFPQTKSLLPNSDWKEAELGEPWYLGDTVNLSIGQGFLLVNPIQLHSAISLIANQGVRCRFTFENNISPNCQKQNFKTKSLAIIKEGMMGACTTGGTGWPFFDFQVRKQKIVVGCKTGTAESQEKDRDPHAWFVMFYPVEKPTIVITVFVENGGEGSSVAAPIAKAILAKYLTF